MMEVGGRKSEEASSKETRVGEGQPAPSLAGVSVLASVALLLDLARGTFASKVCIILGRGCVGEQEGEGR